MKIIVNSGDLADALGKVSRLVKRTQIIPIIGCCKIETGDDAITITSTDFDTQASIAVKCEIEDPGSVALDVHALSGFVGKLPKDSSVTVTGEGKISSARSRASISPLPASDFPSHKKNDPLASFSINSSEIDHLLVLPCRSADTNTIKIYLCGVTLQCVGGALQGTASDGKTVIRSTLSSDAPDFDPIIIPSSTISVLSGMISSADVRVDIHDGSIQFSSETFWLNSRLINEKPAPFDSVIVTEFSGSASVDRLTLLAALDRVGCMTEHKDNLIKIKLNGGPMLIESAIAGATSGVEEIDVSYDGDPISIGLNAKQLSLLASCMTSETIDIRMNEPMTPLSVFCTNHRGTTIITPVRVS